MFPAYDSRERTERGITRYQPAADFRVGRRGVAASISAALHVSAFIALVHAPAVKLPQPSESEYRQSFEGKESKIIWYKFRRELPHVAPPRSETEKALRAENKSQQAIVSSTPNAPRRPKMIWTPAPEIRNIKPLESPNIVAVRLPPPPMRNFTAPPQQQRIAAVAELAAPPPQIAAKQMSAAAMPDLKLAPKPFTAPVIREQRPPERRIIEAEAPSLAPSRDFRSSDVRVKLAAKPFAAPPKQAEPHSLVRIAEADAPALMATNMAESVLPAVTITAPKPFTAPSHAVAAPPVRAVVTESAPPLLEANAHDLNLAVVGLKPVDRPLAPPPSSSPANFSAGRELRKNGANAKSGKGAVSVPGLYVGEAPEKTAAELLAQAFDAPTSLSNLRAAMRSAAPPISRGSGENDATSHSGAVRVSDAPEPRFEGRDVFMMAIQMPNLTSYSGSWLMWYADRTQRVAGLAPIAPPVPHRKVDPKYIASAVADRIEGKVRLACVITKDGTVSGVELLRGLDDRLNKSAEEALGKWEFYPATRNGVPVEVDVIVEIPFRLEPLAPKP